MGPQVFKFEEELKDFLKANIYPVLVSSGTAGIHLALRVLGVTTGDVVLVQSLTFVATANPVTYLGAVPVFIDSEPETWNMCPHQLEMAIEHGIRTGKKPKAIVPVALYGMPYKSNEIQAIAHRYEIPVIEDSAEALGSTYGGKACGTLGRLGVFSFNGNKIITMGSGGVVLAPTPEVAAQVRFLANQAKEDRPYYEHHVTGYNYSQSSILAAVGRAQLAKLPEFVEKRRYIHQFYKDIFQQYPFVEVVSEPSAEFNSNYWLTCIRIKENAFNKSNHGLKAYLEENEIESRYVWKPMHLQPLFQEAPFFGTSVAENIFKQGLCLPSGSGLTDADLARIKQTIERYFTL